MEEPKSLDDLFVAKIFRVPDYQRGYAWQISQYKDFWEDLINLLDDRYHYTGVLTLNQIDSKEIDESSKEYWLVEDHSYKVYNVVDGQQRLTTFVIFIQAFIDFIKQLPENKGKCENEIYITDSLNLSSVIEKYLYKIKPTDDKFRTYKFGYTVDNPSYEFLRYKIFGEAGGGLLEDTFYTLNLRNARDYFFEQIQEFYKQEEMKGLQEIYKKLTRRFLFNEYIIKDEFDVFIAFETMNNRGKKLSDLELLKNRLIYLTTLYTDKELHADGRKSLRDSINDAWKEVYHQLGRNSRYPLNDDDFLKAHWIMYFKFSRVKGNDYIKFLLDEQFSPKKLYKKTEIEVALEVPEEQRTDFDSEEQDNSETQEEITDIMTLRLKPKDIKRYVNSLKESAVHWFNSYYPNLASELSDEEKNALDKLNRIGMGYFRPLIMAILKNDVDTNKRVEVFKEIERFIFIVFKLDQSQTSYRDSEFYNAARELDRKKITIKEIEKKLKRNSEFAFDTDNTFRIKPFYDYLFKKFNNGDKKGFYEWNGLRYFLYEYELSLLHEGRQRKILWEELSKTPNNQVSIEHIFPQRATDYWKGRFSEVPEVYYNFYNGSLGNLLLLSRSINSSLQNDSFEKKKNPIFNEKREKIRNGYSDGSHSEIEVARYPSWGPIEIKERGLTLLTFMEERWNIQFKNNSEKEKLLFLNFKNGES